MLSLRTASAVLSAVIASGCAIHPTPQDQTKVRTHVIVQRIRCETRDALRKELVWYLTNQAKEKKAIELGEKLRNSDRAISAVEITALNDAKIEKFRGSGIAYNFSFDMTEINDLGTTINAAQPLQNGKNLFGFTAGVDRTRHAIRSFTVTDTFEKLLTDLDPSYCVKEAAPPNYMYPITGQIGLEEMVQTFTNLGVTTNLAGKEDGPPTMVDTFEFTTKLSTSITPKLELSPIRHTIRLVDGSVAAVASREDVHQVVIGFALPVTTPPPPKKDKKGKAGTFSNLQVLNFITTKGTSTESAAASAVDQHILRFDVLQRRGIVVQ